MTVRASVLRLAAALTLAAAPLPAAAKVATTVAAAAKVVPGSYAMPAWKVSKSDPAFSGTITGMTKQAGCILHYQSIHEVDPSGTRVLWDKSCSPSLITNLAGKVLNSSIISSGDRRWDPAHPGALLAFRTGGVYRSNTSGGGSGTLVCATPAGYTFPTTSWPLGGTADVSDDGTKVAVTPVRSSDGQPVMQVWNLTTCARTPDVPLGKDWAAGYAEISHGGAYVFVYKGCGTAGAFQACDYGKVYAATGALVQDWSGSKHCPGHADWVKMTDGTERLVGMCKGGTLSGHFVARHPATGAQTDLTQGLKVDGTHASGRSSSARPGWVVVTIGPSGNFGTAGYANLTAECDFLAADGSGAIERIVQTHTKKINSDTEARCDSGDGATVFFNSNGGGSSPATNHGYKGR